MSIDPLLQVIAFGDDHIIVPVSFFQRTFDLGGATHRADYLLFAVVIPNHLFTSQRHNPSRAALLIKDASVIRAGFHVRLIAANGPSGWNHNPAAVLNA